MRATIKVRKNQGNTRYVIDSRKWTGKKQEGKRLFFKTRQEAETYAQELGIELGDGKPIVLTRREQLDYLSAKEILPPDVTLVQAATEYVNRHKKIQKKTVLQVLELCLAEKERANRSSLYTVKFRSRLKSFANDKAIQNANCDEITHEQINDWLHGRGWSQVTKRGALLDATTFFAYAVKHHYCHENPCKKVEAIELEEFERGILTPNEAAVFMQCVREIAPQLTRYFADQLFGGLREDESRNLKAPQVKNNYLELLDTKTKVSRYVEFNDTWLVWRNLGGDYHPIRGWDKDGRRVKKETKRRLIELKAVSADWRFPKNSLRHSFCTYAAKMWGPGRAAELAGHSEAMQKKHYRRPVTLEEAKAFWAIRPQPVQP